MTRHASREGHERASGLISRIAGTSSLLQPYVPGRRPAARAHALDLAAKRRPDAQSSRETAAGELAPLLERLSAAPDLDSALRLLATELPLALGLERVVIALEEPHVSVDSRALKPAVAEPRMAPVTPARVTRPLWLVPRQPAASGDTLEIPIEASRERLGLLRAWVAPDDIRPADAMLAPLRIVCVALGQQVLLLRLRGAAPASQEDSPAISPMALSPGERQRWNALLEYVAHEVKTPLTCMQGHAQLLSRYVRSTRAATRAKSGILVHLLDDCERHLPALEKQVARIEQLLRDTLDLAHSDDGGLQLTRTRTDLVALLNRVARRSEPELARTIAVEAPKTLEVLCDAPRIEQVLGDLLREMARGDLEHDLRVRVTVPEGGGARLAHIAVGLVLAGEAETGLDAQVAQELPDTSTSFSTFGTDSAALWLDLRLALSAAILRQHGGFLRWYSGAAGMCAMVLALPVFETHPIQTGEKHGAPNPHRRR